MALLLYIVLGSFLLALACLGVWRIGVGIFSRRSGKSQIWSGRQALIFAFFLATSAAICQPRQAQPQGLLSGCKSNLKNIGTVLEMYSNDFNGQYPASLSLLTPNYLKTIPRCPAAKTDTYSSSYSHTAANGKMIPHFQIFCRGLNHQQEGIEKPNLPAYDSVDGLDEGHD